MLSGADNKEGQKGGGWWGWKCSGAELVGIRTVREERGNHLKSRASHKQ